MRHTPRRALRRRLASAPFSSAVRLRPVRHVSTREISGMDFEFSEKEEAFRKDVRAWLEGNVPDDLRGKAFAASRAYVDEVRRLRAWQKTMWEAGYVGMNWPKEFGGRGAPLTEQIILFQEMARAESPQFVNRGGLDRKSTRLNSSHGYISYAVFCLKKK